MMENQNNNLVNYIGMFDLLKGIGMLCIVMGHTINNYSFVGAENNIVLIILGAGYILIGAGAIQAFFLISGYGFRKGAVLSTIKKQANLMLKPYIGIMFATTILHIITRYAMSHSLKSALEQTWPVLGGFLFALPANKEMFGMQFYFCGAMWYIIALLLGWILLNTLLNVVRERYMPIAVWTCACVGWFIGKDRIIPFCISQGLIVVLYLYYGYMLKKKKVFAKSMTKAQMAVSGVICAVSMGLIAYAGKLDNMADGVWLLGVISIGLDGYVGYILVRLSLKLNGLKGYIWDGIKKIGSNSLYIFTLHTVEMHGIPWWRFVEYMKDEPVLGCVLHFIMRCIFIIVGVLVFKRIMRLKHKFRTLHRG